MCRKLKATSNLKMNTDSEDVCLEEEVAESYAATFLVVIREWRIWWLAVIWGIVCFGMDGLVFWIPLLIQ